MINISAFLLSNLEGAIFACATATAMTVIGAQSFYCAPMAAAAAPAGASSNVETAPWEPTSRASGWDTVLSCTLVAGLDSSAYLGLGTSTRGRKLAPVQMVEEKWLKILEGPGTITLGVRFLSEMESWILQVSSPAFLVPTCCKMCCGAGVWAGIKDFKEIL